MHGNAGLGTLQADVGLWYEAAEEERGIHAERLREPARFEVAPNDSPRLYGVRLQHSVGNWDCDGGSPRSG